MTRSATSRLDNLLGALVLGVGDALTEATEQVAGHGGAIVAAVTFLDQEPGRSIEQLRAPLGRTQSATVRVVDRLVADGLADRRAGRDGRSIAVCLTPAGEAVAELILSRRSGVLGTATGALDPAERAWLTRLLEKMLAAITTGRSHAERVCRMCDLTVCPREECPVDLAAEHLEAEAAERPASGGTGSATGGGPVGP